MLTTNYLLKKAERTVLVLDGLDEYRVRKSHHITNVMTGATVNHIIITTRPEAANKAKYWKNVTYKEAELKGITDKNIEEYIKNFFKEATDQAKTLISHIFEEDHLHDLARNPGTLSMLCILHDDGQKIHTMNREQLVEEYIAFILSKWEQRQNPKMEKTPRSKILKKYKEVLQKFGQLADDNDSDDDDDDDDVDDDDDDDEDEDTDSLNLCFTVEQINSIVGRDAFQYGFLYRSHPVSLLEPSKLSFTHRTVQEYLLAYFIQHNDIESFKQKLFKDRELLKQQLSLIRFLIHLYFTPTDAFTFTRNIIGSNPDLDLFYILLKLFQGYQNDHKYHNTLTFKDDKYTYIYHYSCYFLCGAKKFQNSLSSFNKEIRIITGNLHKTVTVGVMQTASKQLVTCSDPYLLCDYDIRFYCRQDYKVTVIGNAANLQKLCLYDFEKVAEINLSPVNDNLDVDISNTNLHGCLGSMQSWVALIHSLTMSWCKLDTGDISALANCIQASTSPTGGKQLLCRLQKIDLFGNNLKRAGKYIAKIITSYLCVQRLFCVNAS